MSEVIADRDTALVTRLVVYVGDVHDEMHIITKVIGHDPAEDILRNIVPNKPHYLYRSDHIGRALT